MALSKAITLIESTLPEDQEQSSGLLDALYREKSPSSVRIAVTGSPGAGKSTLINSLAEHLAEQGEKVAVLAIDPSSQETKGSILGDKTRMGDISSHPNIYIRPTPAGKTLGGVSAFTRETIQLVESTGYTTTIIETVGVGQSEYYASQMTDVTVLVLQPGAGDDLQGIKRGIVEVADIFVVNKADTHHIDNARKTQKFYKNALALFHPRTMGFPTPVLLASGLEKTGLDKIKEHIDKLITLKSADGTFLTNRKEQDKKWIEERIKHKILNSFLMHKGVEDLIKVNFARLATNQISPFKIESEVARELQQILK